MSQDPWGPDAPAIIAGDLPPLPPELAELDLFVSGRGPFTPPPGWDPPTERELPEIRTLAAEGWCPVGDMPETRLLPTVWPPQHRAWVPDRLPRVVLAMTLDRTWIEPLGPERGAEAEEFVAQEAAAAGLPPRPGGRIWLLRSPWPSLSAEMVFAVLRQWRDGHELWMRQDGLVVAAREVLGWSEEQVWDTWKGPQAEAAKGWRSAGRPAHEVPGLVLAGLGPQETARLVAPIESGGAGLTEAEAASWAEVVMRPAVGETVDAIIGWRALGLPVMPRQKVWMMLHEMGPREGAAWLADGFTIEDLGALHGIATLDAARRWREHGYAAQRARALLLADRSMVPKEAAAFDAAGIDEAAVVGWVEAGFSAQEARGWTEVDVLPQEARVWRSEGLGPDDARRQKAAGGGELPDGVQVGWGAVGEGREHRRYGVADPPGTRGSQSAESLEIDLLRGP